MMKEGGHAAGESVGIIIQPEAHEKWPTTVGKQIGKLAK
jgi:hypothetical protein